jgi:hypothetical protein
MIYQVFGNVFDSITTDRRPATLGLNVAPKWDNEKCLLRAVQEMDKEITIVMPALQTFKTY